MLNIYSLIILGRRSLRVSLAQRPLPIMAHRTKGSFYRGGGLCLLHESRRIKVKLILPKLRRYSVRSRSRGTFSLVRGIQSSYLAIIRIRLIDRIKVVCC